VAGLWAVPAPLKIGLGRIVPIAYFDEQGRAVGFAIDVINEAARREGISVSWMRLVKGVEEDIQAGTVDLLSAGMSTEQRRQKFYVSEPWWFQELSLLTRADGKRPVKRLGIQKVYIEFARPYYDPATFITEAPGVGEPAAAEAKAVCKDALDGALITHGELHDLFLNRPAECTGVRLQSTDSAITYGLSIISRHSDRAIAERLRSRIDDLVMDGTFLRLAAAHPPLPISGVVHLQEGLRRRYQNRIWIAGGCGVGLLIVTLVWFLWDRQRDLNRTRESEVRIRELNRNLEGNVEQLESLVRDKSLLLREVQHRVKNNLQLISSMASLQARQVGNETAKQAMLTMRERVKSMALIHEGLCFSDALAEIDFGKYVNKLAARLIHSCLPADHTIQLHVDVNVILRLDEATPCGLIVNELLTNALKYAFPDSLSGNIWLTFLENGDEVFLEVRDDGIGLPAGFTVETSRSLGLQVVTDLTAQLHGAFSSSTDGGAIFRVRFRRRGMEATANERPQTAFASIYKGMS
jgi:two-component sensor histidine kinase